MHGWLHSCLADINFLESNYQVNDTGPHYQVPENFHANNFLATCMVGCTAALLM